MQLPGKLSRTTLGDLLGRLHRARATGALELATFGRKHRIHLERGAIVAVEDGAAADGVGASCDDDARPHERDAEERSPREQLRCAVERVFALLDDARAAEEGSIRFHVGVAAKTSRRSPVPLDASEVLHGRRRARDRDAAADSTPRSASSVSGETRLIDSARERACRLLGVSPDANAAAVRRAFRVAASRMHPDRFPSLPSSERASLHAALAQLTAAYHLLVA